MKNFYNIPVRMVVLAEFTSRGVGRFTFEPRGAVFPPLPIASPPRIASAS